MTDLRVVADHHFRSGRPKAESYFIARHLASQSQRHGQLTINGVQLLLARQYHRHTPLSRDLLQIFEPEVCACLRFDECLGDAPPHREHPPNRIQQRLGQRLRVVHLRERGKKVQSVLNDDPRDEDRDADRLAVATDNLIGQVEKHTETTNKKTKKENTLTKTRKTQEQDAGRQNAVHLEHRHDLPHVLQLGPDRGRVTEPVVDDRHPRLRRAVPCERPRDP